MGWVSAVVGAVFGLFLFGRFQGLVVGALLGWLCGTVAALQERIARLEQQVSGSTEPVARSARPARPVEPPPAPSEPERSFVFVTAQDEVVRPTPAARPAPQRPPAATPRESSRITLPEPLQWLFSGENLLVKIGVVILFFGVAFLVKYAAQRGLFPVQLRLAAAALGGLGLLALGWRLRGKRREYALTLQGGGVGILYITAYAAFRLYGFLDPLAAFALLATIAASSVGLAVGQNALALAFFGVVGGFLAPLLAPTGGGPALLFGYCLVLNLGITATAWYRSWRLLNLVGFVATFVCGLWWGGHYYHPWYFSTVEPFLIAFFLLYIAIATLFAWRQPPGTRGIVDGTLVFGTPITAFALQAALVADQRYGLAWSALGAGLIYLGLAAALRRMLPLLSDAYLSFGALFVTLAVPLAFDGRWTSAFWAVEGAAVLWVALRQGRTIAAGFGLVLQFAAGIAFLLGLKHPAAEVALLNANYLGMLLLTAAALATAWRLRQCDGPLANWGIDRLLTVWGLLWWYGGGLREIEHFASHDQVPLLVLLFLAASAWGYHLAGRRLVWRDLAAPGVLLLPALLLAALLSGAHHPLENGGGWGWLVALASLWALLYRSESDLPASARTPLHAGAIWLLAGLTTWELLWQVRMRFGSAGNWHELALIAASGALLALLCGLSRGRSWPCGRERLACLGVAALPLAAWGWLWIFVTLFSRGDAWPWPWVPFCNPLDLAALAVLGVLFWWWCRLTATPELAEIAAPLALPARLLGVAIAFLWFNAALARGLSHARHLPYEVSALFHSPFVQTSYTLVWTLLALAGMFHACRRRVRPLWLCGAGLLGVVVVKLFSVDLAGSGTIERIVSFVAVGALLLVIGWLAPVPPHAAERGSDQADARQP